MTKTPPAPVAIGYVTRLGYLHCVGCRPVSRADDIAAVERGSRPHAAETCDICHKALDAQAVST